MSRLVAELDAGATKPAAILRVAHALEIDPRLVLHVWANRAIERRQI